MAELRGLTTALAAAVLVVSHDGRLAAGADRVLRLEEGLLRS